MLPHPMAIFLSSLEANPVSDPGSHCFPLEALRIQGPSVPWTCLLAEVLQIQLICFPVQPDPPDPLEKLGTLRDASLSSRSGFHLLSVPHRHTVFFTPATSWVLALPVMSGLLPSLLAGLPIFCLCLYFILHNTAQGALFFPFRAGEMHFSHCYQAAFIKCKI